MSSAAHLSFLEVTIQGVGLCMCPCLLLITNVGAQPEAKPRLLLRERKACGYYCKRGKHVAIIAREQSHIYYCERGKPLDYKCRRSARSKAMRESKACAIIALTLIIEGNMQFVDRSCLQPAVFVLLFFGFTGAASEPDHQPIYVINLFIAREGETAHKTNILQCLVCFREPRIFS